MIKQISPKDAWEALKNNQNSLLIDVRTKEELDFVGRADLSAISGNFVHAPFKLYPNMNMDESFTDKLSDFIAKSFPNQNSLEINLIFMCRSGARSAEAAMYMGDLGYQNCHNLSNGFEGQVDNLGHRGTINGWKADNLAWRQS